MARAAEQDAERKRRLIAATEAKVAEMEQACEQQTQQSAAPDGTLLKGALLNENQVQNTHS